MSGLGRRPGAGKPERDVASHQGSFSDPSDLYPMTGSARQKKGRPEGVAGPDPPTAPSTGSEAAHYDGERGEGAREGFRSGFVPVVGRPNVGKSTLINRIVGEKVSIVSDKPQTTRNRICGVLTGPDHQVVFLDTPGIHKARDEINRYMVDVALATLEEADLVLFLVEPAERPGAGDRYVFDLLCQAKATVLLLVNKMDRMPGAEWEDCLARHRIWYPGVEAYPVSALTGEGIPEIVDGIIRNLPEGPLYFPPDQWTDQPLRALSAEIIREKIFHLTSQEVPYSVAVEIVRFEESTSDKGGLVSIEANIHVERESQKGILIGKGGEMLKRIGSLARREIEALTGAPVFLRLWVKVSRGWKKDPAALKRFGYG